MNLKRQSRLLRQMTNRGRPKVELGKLCISTPLYAVLTIYFSRGYDSERYETADNTAEMASGHRKRPRKEVVEDATAKARREALGKEMRNMARRARGERTRNMLAGVVNAGMIRINIGKYARDNDIFFHPSLADVLKPHQVEGIRFMWQQLVQTGENRGALLAHTMGLGKTLQV